MNLGTDAALRAEPKAKSLTRHTGCNLLPSATSSRHSQTMFTHLHRLSGLVLFLAATAALIAAPMRLVILHTNDVHDHIRPGENGRDGLPYVSGYVHQVRAADPNVLVLDAGDVTEKGDLVAFRSHGVTTYEAMGRIGYDGVCVGNHDFDDIPPDRIRLFEKSLGQELLCLNIVQPDGARMFRGSRIVVKGGVKIGLIGMIVPRKHEQGGLDSAESGRALADESQRLRSAGAQLVVAVCHESVPKCADWSRLAPKVNVFVSGHSHTALKQPEVVPETGAIIVQAGSYARWVGRLELEVDVAAGKVVKHSGWLVPMDHATVPVDAAMLAWVREREQALAPEADDFVCDNPAELDHFSMARLGARGLKEASGAEIAFCHAYQVIRDVLPKGRVDVNAVFKVGGDRGGQTVLVMMTGAEIEAYVNALVGVQREPPEWTGFRVRRQPGPKGAEIWQTDLESSRRYQVLFPRIEWETRLLRLREKLLGTEPDNPLVTGKFNPVPAPVNFTDATVTYMRRVIAEGDSLQSRAARLAQERELAPKS